MAQAACSRRSRIATHVATFILSILLMLGARGAVAGGVNLAWDPVNSTSLAGYMLYYGPSVGSYTNKIDVGNRTSYSVSNLTDGAIYHFVVTAYDASHVESGYSNDVAATLAAGGLVANFTASTTSGVAPLAMNFTSTSTGSITSYLWSFGDGTSSASQSPAHVYGSPGVYTVSLTVSGSGGTNTKTMPNYITVTPGGDTTAPSAPGALTGTVSGTAVNLTWQTATDNVGVAEYRVERCDGSTCASFAQIGTSSSNAYTDGSRTAGASYRYRVRAADAAGNLGVYSNVVTVSIPLAVQGTLTGSLASSSATQIVNVSTVGTSDWAVWPSGDRKATGASQIAQYATIGTASTAYSTGDLRTVTWSDGAPATSGTTNGGVSVATANSGMQFTVPADTSTRTLVVYVGAQSATGTFRAHLSDGSAADYVATLNAQQKRVDGQFTVTYRAATAGQTLTVTWVRSSQKNGNVSLQGAALAVATSAVAALVSTCPCSAWDANAAPTVADHPDWNAVELGVKFRTDVAGLITGVRFYKSLANSGTHVGNLWRTDGTLLAQATFVNETASGWQQVNFNPPVPIAANTTYIASYHTNVGHYAGDNWFFSAAGVDNGAIHLLRDGVDGGSGVYRYGGASAFPSQTYNATNYWVDVVFTPN